LSYEVYIMIKNQIVFFTLAFFAALSCVQAAEKAKPEDEYPGRNVFPEVEIYEVTELYQQKDQVVIVDVRSKYEYETLRAKGALNIPLSSSTFGEELRKLRASTEKPIVFYCNGRTCYKSYKAARKALYYKVENCFSFDAGIFDWAKAHPGEAVLLGRSPINVNDLISKSSFKKKLIEPNKFGLKVGSKSIVLDVRDRFQREAIGFFPGQERRVSLDQKEKLEKMFAKAKRERKTLLIYDAVGKQVRWLMYSLRLSGITDYYFMKGGAKGYYDMLAAEQWTSSASAKN